MSVLVGLFVVIVLVNIFITVIYPLSSFILPIFHSLFVLVP